MLVLEEPPKDGEERWELSRVLRDGEGVPLARRDVEVVGREELLKRAGRRI